MLFKVFREWMANERVLKFFLFGMVVVVVWGNWKVEGCDVFEEIFIIIKNVQKILRF
jgi:hypothetical protein